MAQLEDLANLGMDALGNHYMITLPTSITYLAGVSDPMTMRITSISLPGRSIETYDITRRGRKLSRPNGIVANEKEVTFNFRPDKQFLTYKAISNWMDYIQGNLTASLASDSGANGTGGASLFRAPIVVSAINDLNDGGVNSVWTLEGAYPTALDGIEFSEESGEPFDISCTLNCMNIIYPI